MYLLVANETQSLISMARAFNTPTSTEAAVSLSTMSGKLPQGHSWNHETSQGAG